MSKIKDIIGREILDSRGNPTVEVDVVLESGVMGRASVASGASTGSKEALELRDNDFNRYNGKGVLKAIDNINKIKDKIIGMDVLELDKIDEVLIELDGTEYKTNLGANCVLGISLGCLKALAKYKNCEIYELYDNDYSIPRPMINILNGGAHADNKLDFQEFMIIPMKDDYKLNLQIASEVFHSLKKLLKEEGLSCGVGDEGGFAPMVNSNEEALDLILQAIEKAGYKVMEDIALGLDVAATEFYKDGYYCFDNKKLTSEELSAYYEELVSKYPIISIEDPMAEDDHDGWKMVTDSIGKDIQIVGDDLFVTNSKLLQMGIDMGIANAILIKLNQIGTVTETINTIKLAKDNNYKTIISHRSGETEDNYIADLAVGLNVGQIKTGSVCRGERISKYNQLIRIDEKINN